VPPTSVAEFTLNGGGNVDYYDVSLVDGYDLPIAIAPDNAQCGGPSCVADLLATCPAELQNGVVLWQYDCNGTGAQSFRLVPQ